MRAFSRTHFGRVFAVGDAVVFSRDMKLFDKPKVWVWRVVYVEPSRIQLARTNPSGTIAVDWFSLENLLNHAGTLGERVYHLQTHREML